MKGLASMMKISIKVSVAILLLFTVFAIFFYKVKNNEVISTTLLYVYQDFFVEADKPNNLMLGSSTIRKIDSKKFLACGPWLNRGIGNSTLSVLENYLSITPLAIIPAKILLYAGENDISRGDSIESTIHSYKELIQSLLVEYPGSDVHIIAIKPSPKRRKYWESFGIVNSALDVFSTESNNVYFHSYSNQEEGYGLSSFASDGVHLSEEGYSVFTTGFNKGCKVN